jgi:hypothetical protein
MNDPLTTKLTIQNDQILLHQAIKAQTQFQTKEQAL